jgi:Flp pilus assembly protein TadB
VTDDAFLTSLKVAWRGDRFRRDAVARGFRNHRRWVLWTFLSSALGALCVFAGFVLLARTAYAGREPLLAVSALAFAAGLPAILLGFATLRRLRLHYDETPLGLLQQSRNRADTMHRLLWGARCCAGILGAAAVAALVLTVTLQGKHIADYFIVAIWGSTALVVWVWQARRKQTLGREIASLDDAIAEFEEALGADTESAP